MEVVPHGSAEEYKITTSIDLLGFFCPVPIVETRKKLMDINASDILEVWSDDPEVLHDLPILIQRTGDEILSIEELSGEYRFLILKCGD